MHRLSVWLYYFVKCQQQVPNNSEKSCVNSCTIFRYNFQKKFWKGAQPPPTLHPFSFWGLRPLDYPYQSFAPGPHWRSSDPPAPLAAISGNESLCFSLQLYCSNTTKELKGEGVWGRGREGEVKKQKFLENRRGGKGGQGK